MAAWPDPDRSRRRADRRVQDLVHVQQRWAAKRLPQQEAGGSFVAQSVCDLCPHRSVERGAGERQEASLGFH